ncbi:SRPBCC family protein [Coleofasciculus sp. FACHB-SPT36]|uniref:SRPBCC family protein n=1 Tax=Cyanophyceae TaxID=3028117 RepID=UPI00168AF017|nr:SRPBCC family protein [Coleofasciculus sp. FACHB-SPT36]MBD2541928.1 cyclase [Coleofasciculus sp. FACHB-SPT36]
MSILFPSDSMDAASDLSLSKRYSTALLQGEILIETQLRSTWGGAVTAQMYLPNERSLVWQQVTDYPRWVQYFPDVTHSEVLHSNVSSPVGLPEGTSSKSVYQVATKTFLFLSLQVEAYLSVSEIVQQEIHFRLEKGTFTDFCADLSLQDYENGTLLTYTVKATPNIPVPSIFIEQAMQLELPVNMRTMRQVMCGS